MSEKNKLSHFDASGKPQMVNVSAKSVTKRTASAQAIVRFPADVFRHLQESSGQTAKGSLIDTAVIAGVMAAKRTHELIPFCHPLGLENCSINIAFADDYRIVVDCKTSVTHKTGVEMEALTGASVAALTIYDMCKALSHSISIESIRLLEKSGGKNDFIG